MYVERLQLTTIFLPLLSAGCYRDGNSPGKPLENSGKQNPKMGFKSPTEHRRKFSISQGAWGLIAGPIPPLRRWIISLEG